MMMRDIDERSHAWPSAARMVAMLALALTLTLVVAVDGQPRAGGHPERRVDGAPPIARPRVGRRVRPSGHGADERGARRSAATSSVITTTTITTTTSSFTIASAADIIAADVTTTDVFAADVIATVQTGAIRGSLDAAGRAIFMGVPFARPPVGDLRWREPQAPEPWTGVRDALAASPACMQNPLGTGVFITQLAGRYGVAYQAPRWNLSEDCLYLNVYAPAWPMKTPAAVMVWLHGGSNVTGAGSEYHAARLASRGVIIVTTNYRLGALGFFAHPELTRESPHGASGNYGLLDQIGALRWVRRNIAAFGGDPSKVTVFGESAGAIDAGVLMASPLAVGLFQRVIVQSGPVLGLVYPPPRATGEQFGLRVAAAALAGTTAAGNSAGEASLRALRALPPETILAAAKTASAQEPDPGIILDGYLLPRAPAEVFARREQQPVALMIGNNARELSVYRSPPASGAGAGAAGSAGGGAVTSSGGASGSGSASGSAAASGPINDMSGPKKTLRIFYGRMGTLVIGLYAVEARIGSASRADGWLNDVLATCPSAAMAALNAAAGRPAYVYQFRRSIPGKGESDLGAFHGLELPFVFESFQEPVWRWLAFTPADVALSDRMQRYWTNFAKTGNPNGADLPEWRGFNTAGEDYLAFERDGRAVPSQGVRPTFCQLDLPTLSQRLLDNP
jgi:para-nitrobenzyl esterase